VTGGMRPAKVRGRGVVPRDLGSWGPDWRRCRGGGGGGRCEWGPSEYESEGPHLAAVGRAAGCPTSWPGAADRLAWEAATEMPVARPSCRPGFPGVPGVSPRKDFRLSDE
jgi:hypothetical protein